MSFLEKVHEARQKEQIKAINERLTEIENAVFAHSKETLDAYTKSILVAHLVENQKNVDDLKFYIINAVKQDNPNSLSKRLVAFMLRWGWSILAVIAAFAFWWMMDIRSKYDIVQEKSGKQAIIEQVVQYDKVKDLYFIEAKDYTVENEKKGEFKGIIIKTPTNESVNQ